MFSFAPKRVLVACFVALALTGFAIGDDRTPVLATSTADADWNRIQTAGLLDRSVAPDFLAMSARKRLESLETKYQQLREQGLAFLAEHPNDPRRSWIIWRMHQMPPRFITSIGPSIEANPSDYRVDEKAATAWREELAKLVAELEGMPDLPLALREERAAERLSLCLFDDTAGDASTWSPERWSALTDDVLRFAREYLEGNWPVQEMIWLTSLYKRSHTDDEMIALWERFAASPHALVAERARQAAVGLRTFSELRKNPIELRFTALDGTPIDLEKLRGKVVLFDFWATWCGPCMEEMPHVRKVYEEFRERGLEVIGVSCDTAPDPNKPRTGGHLAKSADEVLAFTRKHAMPWPCHYEGRGLGTGGNTLVARFGVTAIPMTFLLGRDGRVIAKDLRGEALYQAIARALAP